MIDHEPYLRLAAGRQLGALDDAETAELDQHLAICAACAAEARRLEAVADELLLAAPPRQPPEWMRPAILAAITAEREMEPHVGRAPAQEPERRPAPGSTRRQLDRAPTPGWLAWLTGRRAGLAAAGLAVVLVVVSVGVGLRAVDLQSQLDARTGAAAAAQARLADEAAALDLALDPGHVSAPLASEALAPGAVAEVVYRPGTDRAYLIATGLPPTPAGHVYQLWYADGSGAHPLGTFTFDGNGPAVASFGVDLAGKAAAMVTLEAAGGATGAPGPQVVFGKLPGA